MTLRLAPFAAAALLAAAPLRAQPAPAALPDSGARVRVVLVDRDRVLGTLVAREPGRWLVVRERGDTIAVAPLQVERLDVSGGLRSPGAAFWRGARTGALVGGTVTVAGFGILAVTGGLDCGHGDKCFIPPAVVVGVAGGALTLATTLAGGIAGSYLRERWERVPLTTDARIGVVVTPHGGALAVRLPVPR